MKKTILTEKGFKRQARRLREINKSKNCLMSHAQALDELSKIYGYKDYHEIYVKKLREEGSEQQQEAMIIKRVNRSFKASASADVGEKIDYLLRDFSAHRLDGFLKALPCGIDMTISSNKRCF